MELKVTVTVEEVKAVEGIVVDAQAWLQDAWNGKANNCLKRVIEQDSNLNPNKLTKEEKVDWVKNNTFKTRKEKDAEQEETVSTLSLAELRNNKHIDRLERRINNIAFLIIKSSQRGDIDFEQKK